jgi:hypothetical protein
MAEFQWWLLLVGLVAGGGLVAIVTMDGRRREEDLADLERQAEATWIADRLHGPERDIDARTVGTILRIHREYLSLPPPDRIVVEGGEEPPAAADAPSGGDQLSDRDADRDPDDVGHDGGGRPDQDLPRA